MATSNALPDVIELASLARNAELDALADAEVIAPKVARAAAIGVGVRRGGGWEVEVGAAGRLPEGPAGVDAVYDLASVSKSFVAATFARLSERGAVSHATRVRDLLPECLGSWAQDATLEALLTHRAGLAPHRRLFAPVERKRSFERGLALRSAAASRGDGAPGSAVYSDLGYLLAGEMLSRAAELPLDRLVQREVATPLDVHASSRRLRILAGKGGVQAIAPSEFVPTRGGWLRGVVHDENAWAFAGHGLAGHAGLFGNVRDVLRFGMALLDALAGRQQSWLGRATVRGLVAERANGSFRLGFDGKSAQGSSAGVSASAQSFGHLGFTGTSFWCDPLADAVTVLLTNRVCPTRQHGERIRACRPRVHETLFARAARAH